MNYKSAEQIFPPDLIEKIQQYVDGQFIYIPRKVSNKKCWGYHTETKVYLDKRNNDIFEKYKLGSSVKELAEHYFLSEKTIYKIIATRKRIQ